MAKKDQTGRPVAGSATITIRTEDGTLSRSGNELFDFGKVLDGNLANDNNVEKYKGSSIIKKYSGSHTPTTLTEYDYTTSMILCSILPTIGGELGQFRWQLAFKDQFVKAVGDSYYNTNLTEADLIKLFMYSEGLAGLLMVIALGLKLSKKQSNVNATISERALRLYGFDYTEIATKREQYINLYNRLVKILNEKFYLAENDALRQFMYLIDHIFVDSVSQKAQLILFRPVLYTEIDFTDGTVEPEVTLWQDEELVTSEPTIDLSKLVAIVEKAERFSSSAWYDTVAPNMFHLYGDRREGLIQFGTYVDEDPIFTFNYAVIDAIRNGKIVNQLITPDSSIAGKARIYEDTNGYIRQGGSNLSGYLGLTCNSICWGTDSSNNVVDVLKYYNIARINVDEYPSDAATKANAMTFYFTESDAVNGSGTVLNPVHNYIQYCGHVLLLRKTLVKFSVTTTGWSFTSLKDVDYVGQQFGAHMTPSNRAVNLMSANWITYFSTNVSSNKLLVDTYQVSGVIGGSTYIILHDKDNVFVIPDSLSRDYFIQLVYDSANFRVPEFHNRK